MGYATPYLPALADGAERTIAFMPAVQGVVNWPPEGPNAAALVADDALPLPDAMIDRVLVIHSLEMSESPREQLREIWRVLAPGGRVLLVVPNRRGIWAWAEKTPFGYGRPFTRGQLTALLRDTMFSPLGWSEALAAPPIRRRPWLRTGNTWEQIGVALWGAFAGVIIVEATKQLYQGIPARARGRLKPAFRLGAVGQRRRPTGKTWRLEHGVGIGDPLDGGKPNSFGDRSAAPSLRRQHPRSRGAVSGA